MTNEKPDIPTGLFHPVVEASEQTAEIFSPLDQFKKLVPNIVQKTTNDNSFEDGLKKDAEQIGALITSARIANAFPTEDLRKTFDNIPAATIDMFNLAVLGKKLNLLKIVEMGIFDNELLKNSAMLYVGAGYDVEYPLSFGARKITMIDPALKEVNCLENVRNRIQRISEGDFKEDLNTFSFKFDFGEGDEEVVIKIDPRSYVKEDNTYIPKVDHFITQDSIGAIIAFQGEDIFINNEIVSKLLPKGIIYNNQSSNVLFDEFFETQAEGHEGFSRLTPSEQFSLLSEFYKNKGFTAIKIGSTDNDIRSVVFKKN